MGLSERTVLLGRYSVQANDGHERHATLLYACDSLGDLERTELLQ